MAVLVGQDTYTGRDLAGSFSPNDGILHSSYTCVESGTLETLHAQLENSSGNIQLAIYDAAGTTLLGRTDTISTTAGAGEYSAALLSGVSVTASTSYRLALFSDANYIDARVAATGDRACAKMGGQTFATWPSAITEPPGGFSGSVWTIWGEGSSGGSAPSITDAGDETYTNGETGIVITGTSFGASQGSGTVKISPTDNVADSNAVTQTVTAWSDTSITFTCVRGSLALNTNLYLFVTSDGAYSNASGHVVQIAGTRKLKVLTHSSAAGATSIDVAVYAAPTTEPIHGALIGQATGQAFEASLEAGQAVLKVPVSAFGGGALTTSDTPRVLARNGTYTTGNIPATVIEE